MKLLKQQVVFSFVSNKLLVSHLLLLVVFIFKDSLWVFVCLCKHLLFSLGSHRQHRCKWNSQRWLIRNLVFTKHRRYLK